MGQQKSSFGVRRLNLHLLPLLSPSSPSSSSPPPSSSSSSSLPSTAVRRVSEGGRGGIRREKRNKKKKRKKKVVVIVVDSTANKKKRFPDAFTLTLPLWCSVLNRLSFSLLNNNNNNNNNKLNNDNKEKRERMEREEKRWKEVKLAYDLLPASYSTEQSLSSFDLSVTSLSSSLSSLLLLSLPSSPPHTPSDTLLTPHHPLEGNEMERGENEMERGEDEMERGEDEMERGENEMERGEDGEEGKGGRYEQLIMSIKRPISPRWVDRENAMEEVEKEEEEEEEVEMELVSGEEVVEEEEEEEEVELELVSGEEEEEEEVELELVSGEEEEEEEVELELVSVSSRKEEYKGYIKGAGDDEETWAPPLLSPSSFWSFLLPHLPSSISPSDPFPNDNDTKIFLLLSLFAHSLLSPSFPNSPFDLNNNNDNNNNDNNDSNNTNNNTKNVPIIKEKEWGAMIGKSGMIFNHIPIPIPSHFSLSLLHRELAGMNVDMNMNDPLLSSPDRSPNRSARDLLIYMEVSEDNEVCSERVEEGYMHVKIRSIKKMKFSMESHFPSILRFLSHFHLPNHRLFLLSPADPHIACALSLYLLLFYFDPRCGLPFSCLNSQYFNNILTNINYSIERHYEEGRREVKKKEIQQAYIYMQQYFPSSLNLPKAYLKLINRSFLTPAKYRPFHPYLPS